MDRQLHIDNHTLVEECKNGDKEALNLFYLRFAPRMLSVIRRYVSDVKDAEDILHDGFIVAFTRLGSLRDADRVDYWLATIMKNLSLQFLQSQDVAQMLHEIPEVEDTPQIDEIIDLATLEMLIKKLPAGYQKVFRLAVLENKSHKEIAKLLGIAPNSSSSQLFHAKLMMRKLITDYKKQTGIWCLLLLCGGAGIMLWHTHKSSRSSLPLLSHESKLPSASPANAISLSPSANTEVAAPANIDTVPMPTAPSNHIVSVGNMAVASQKVASSISLSSVNTGLLSNVLPGNKIDNTNLPDNSDASPNNDVSPNNSENEHNPTKQNNINNELLDEANSNNELIAHLSEKLDEIEERHSEMSDTIHSEMLDSVKVNAVPGVADGEVYYAYLDDTDILSHRSVNKSLFGDWSVRVSADAGLLAFNTDASSVDDYFSSSEPGCCQNPSNPGDGDPNNPDDSDNSDNSNNSDKKNETRLPRRSAPAYKDYRNIGHTNYLPISFSLAVNKVLDNTFSVETGLTYTYLHTTFEAFPSISNCHWHYLGIPLKLDINLCSSRRVKMYTAIGGIMDIPLYSNAHVTTTSGSSTLWGGKFNSPVVWSFSASYGISIKLSKKVDIFLEPTLQYHFDHNVTVPNVWSDEKWGFSLPIGFRFNL